MVEVGWTVGLGAKGGMGVAGVLMLKMTQLGIARIGMRACRWVDAIMGMGDGERGKGKS